MQLISEGFEDSHVVSSFSCGKEPLDRWLRNAASQGHARDTGRTFVWHEGDGVILAYFTLAGHALHRDHLSRTQAKSLPVEVPAILLAKLALDQSLHGQGLGADLLIDALTRCVAAADIVASRFVVVDAIDDEAARFYQKYAFDRIPDTGRLIRRLKDIRADLTDD